MTENLKNAIAKLEALKIKHSDALKTLAVVQCKFGQEMTHVTVGGHTFTFQNLSRESGWMPYVVEGCEELQQAAEKIMINHVRSLAAKVEGAKWKVQQLAKDLK